MRNRLLIFIVSVCGWVFFFSGFSQQSPEVEEIAFPVDSFAQKQQIENDSLLRIAPIDTASVKERAFASNIPQKYANDDALNYERSNGGKTLLVKIKEWINNLIRKLLGLDELADINRISSYILNILYAIILLAIVYFIVRLVMNHKGRWFFDKKAQPVEINVENVEEHIHEANFENLIRETEKNGNTRQSTRLYYLWLLKTFTDKGIIEWNPEKTNADYTREISEEKLKNEFRYLSYLYNHIWYGEFSINNEEYQQAKKAFINHLNRNGK